MGVSAELVLVITYVYRTSSPSFEIVASTRLSMVTLGWKRSTRAPSSSSMTFGQPVGEQATLAVLSSGSGSFAWMVYSTSVWSAPAGASVTSLSTPSIASVMVQTRSGVSDELVLVRAIVYLTLSPTFDAALSTFFENVIEGWKVFRSKLSVAW